MLGPESLRSMHGRFPQGNRPKRQRRARLLQMTSGDSRHRPIPRTRTFAVGYRAAADPRATQRRSFGGGGRSRNPIEFRCLLKRCAPAPPPRHGGSCRNARDSNCSWRTRSSFNFTSQNHSARGCPRQQIRIARYRLPRRCGTNHYHHQTRVAARDRRAAKEVEYRELKPYWTHRLNAVSSHSSCA